MAGKLKTVRPKRSACPIAAALDLVGDKWSLLIIRDIGLFHKHRNKEFQEGDEGIPSNILANRLRQLADNGLIEKQIYQQHPPRFEYHLTEAGRSLLPVLGAMANWANDHVPGVSLPESLSSSGRR
jgi:DNA-binding HxlR family transcriptional regulator